MDYVKGRLRKGGKPQIHPFMGEMLPRLRVWILTEQSGERIVNLQEEESRQAENMFLPFKHDSGEDSW